MRGPGDPPALRLPAAAGRPPARRVGLRARGGRAPSGPGQPALATPRWCAASTCSPTPRCASATAAPTRASSSSWWPPASAAPRSTRAPGRWPPAWRRWRRPPAAPGRPRRPRRGAGCGRAGARASRRPEWRTARRPPSAVRRLPRGARAGGARPANDPPRPRPCELRPRALRRASGAGARVAGARGPADARASSTARARRAVDEAALGVTVTSRDARRRCSGGPSTASGCGPPSRPWWGGALEVEFQAGTRRRARARARARRRRATTSASAGGSKTMFSAVEEGGERERPGRAMMAQG